MADAFPDEEVHALMTGRFWTRLAAASGVAFAGVAVALYVIGSVKHLGGPGDFAVKASNDLWATYVLLIGVAGVLLLWFTSISAARLRVVEGGSGRLASEHLVAGSVIAALLFVEVAVQFGARTAANAAGLDSLATAVVSGPVITFAASVYAYSAGVIGIRAGNALPFFSGVMARLSFLLGVALLAGGGLWLYRNYGWLDDAAFFAFVGWVLVRSALGTFRWADLDAESFVRTAPARRAARSRQAAVRVADETDDFEIPALVRKARSGRKAAGRRGTARKAPVRKPVRKKPAGRKPGAGRTVSRRATPPPAPVTESLESLDLEGPEDI